MPVIKNKVASTKNPSKTNLKSDSNISIGSSFNQLNKVTSKTKALSKLVSNDSVASSSNLRQNKDSEANVPSSSNQSNENHVNQNENSSITKPQEIVSSLSNKLNEDFQVGDIVWAKIGKYPFWPSIVSIHPETKTYIEGPHINKTFALHVRFCNNQGKRSWVKKIEPFFGKDKFLLKYPKCLLSIKYNKKEKQVWNLATEEAENLLKYDKKERIIQFYTKYELGCPPVPTSIVPIVVKNDTSDSKVLKVPEIDILNDKKKENDKNEAVVTNKKENSNKKSVVKQKKPATNKPRNPTKKKNSNNLHNSNLSNHEFDYDSDDSLFYEIYNIKRCGPKLNISIPETRKKQISLVEDESDLEDSKVAKKKKKKNK